MSSIDAGPPVALGEVGPRVAQLRDVLEARGYVAQGEHEVFDEHLKAALQQFQSDNDLRPDGIAGRVTLAALSITADEAIAAITSSLAPPDWPERGRAIVVNIPEQTVRALDEGHVVLKSRVVIGTARRPTPVISGVFIQSVTVNPSWSVPPRIAREDFGGRRFTMPPGPDNPLGKWRFDMPNRYMAFLHGTNREDLFERDRRLASSGCIRVQNVELFARWLIGDDRWASEGVDASMQTWITRRIDLEVRVPVIHRISPHRRRPGRICQDPS